MRVQLNLGNETLSGHLRRAVESVPHASIVSQGPHLLLTDRPGRPSEPRTWLTRFRPGGDDTQAYTGPFILDRSHPLAEGLSLEGVIWAAGQDERMPGTPIVAAGNTVLVSASEQPDGGRTLRLRYHPELSTLHNSPNWPVLIWNLLEWRGDHLPGLKRPNVRLGGEATLTVEPETQSVELTDPAGKSRRLSVGQRRLSLLADRPGVWRIEADDRTHRFAVNALSRSESGMSERSAGRWGDWTEAAAFRWQYQNLAWIFALIAAALLVTHMALVARLAGTGAAGGGRV